MSKQLFLFFAIFTVLASGCKKNDNEVVIHPVVLSHYRISIGDEKGDAVRYQDIPTDGYNDTIKILKGNGKYELTMIQNTLQHFPASKMRTQSTVIGDSIIVVNIKGPTQEEAKLIRWSLRCIDIYCITDSRGEKKEFEIKDRYYVGDIDM